MKMRALNHVNLVVSDVERSAGFYQRVFGLERQWKEGDFVFMTCGDTDLGLVGGRPASHRRFHIGFRVAGRPDVDDWREHLERQGVELEGETRDYGGYYTLTCRDPDGYGIEIYFEPGLRGRVGFPADQAQP